MILNPSASHFAFGKIEVRRRFVLEGSRAFGVSYVYSNLLGNEAGRAIYDGGALIASAGQLRGGRAAVFVRRCSSDHGAGRYRRHADGPRSQRQLHAGISSMTTDCDPRVVCVSGATNRSVGRVRQAAWEAGAARERRGIHAGDCAGAIRLSAEEPLARVRRVDQRRGRFGGRFVPGRGAGATGRRRIGPGRVSDKLNYMPEYAAATSHERVRLMVARQLTVMVHVADLRLPIDSQQRRRHAQRRPGGGRGARRRVYRIRRRCAGAGLYRHRLAGDRPAAELGDRRPGPAKHSSPRALAGRLAAGESAAGPAGCDQQSQRSGRRLCHDGWRHVGRHQPDRRHRQGVPAPLAALVRRARARKASARCRPWPR